jgi:uridine phosphorylase
MKNFIKVTPESSNAIRINVREIAAFSSSYDDCAIIYLSHGIGSPLTSNFITVKESVDEIEKLINEAQC